MTTPRLRTAAAMLAMLTSCERDIGCYGLGDKVCPAGYVCAYVPSTGEEKCVRDAGTR